MDTPRRDALGREGAAWRCCPSAWGVGTLGLLFPSVKRDWTKPGALTLQRVEGSPGRRVGRVQTASWSGESGRPRDPGQHPPQAILVPAVPS